MVVSKVETGLIDKKDITKLHSFFDEMDIIFDEAKIKSFLQDKNNILFVAKADGEILGFAFGYLINRIDNKYPKFYIHSLYVGSEYQNKGIGTKLLDFVVKFANKNNCSSVFTIADKKNGAAVSVFSHLDIKHKINGKVLFTKKFNRG